MGDTASPPTSTTYTTRTTGASAWLGGPEPLWRALPGRALVTLYEPGRMRAVVQVPASRAASLRGRAAQVELPPDAHSGAPSRWVTPLRATALPGTDPVAQTVEWRLDLPADAAGRPGQSVRVRWAGDAAAGAKPAPGPLSVPASALLRRGELTAVYVAREGGFSLRAVHAGTPGPDGQVPVLAGLKAGERVAVQAERAGLAGAQPAAR